MGLVSLYLINFIHNSYTSALKNNLHRESVILAKNVTPYIVKNDIEEVEVFVKNIESTLNSEISIIDSTGKIILGDNNQLLNTPEIQMSLTNEFGYRESSDNNLIIQDKFYVAISLHDNNELLGFLHIVNHSSQIQSDIYHIILTVIISGVVVTIITILFGTRLSAKITESVSSILKGAQIISEGNLTYRVQTSAKDETKDLAIAFNSMAISLQEIVRELSEEKDILYAVLETMSDGVIVVAQNSEIVMMNDASRNMLQTLDTPSHHKRFGEVIRDHRLQELLSICITEHRPQEAELEFRYPYSFLKVIATPLIQDNRDSGVGALFTLHDLTQTYQIETTRREFVSNVSHELRSPLAAIKAMSETLEGGAINDASASYDFLHRINNEVDRMTQLTNDLLDLARLENNKSEILPTRIQLLPFLQGFISEIIFQNKENPRNISLDTEFENAVLIIDEGKIRQVLQNLVNNAIQYTQMHENIIISAKVTDDKAIIQVKDEGQGIPAEHQPHIFERFYKVDRSRKDSGTGLGLAIAKHIVQLHHGLISVQSTVGSGTKFEFTLPLVKEQ